MKRIIVTDIDWDAPEDVAATLPQEITIDITPENEYLLDDSEQYAENIGDAISDITGWCHYSFCVEVAEVPDEG